MSAPPARPSRALDVAGKVVGGALAGLARLRGGKAVHPHGVSYAARLAIEGTSAAPPASELLSQKANRPALVRFSRSLGLPRPLPDLAGSFDPRAGRLRRGPAPGSSAGHLD